MTEVAVWAEPIERRPLQLVTGDIKEAINCFRDKTGQEAKLIILHPSNKHLANEVGDGIRVDYLGGCLAFEVWLSSEDNSGTPVPDTQVVTESISETPKAQSIASYPETKKSTLNPIKSRVDFFRPRGRPKTYKKRLLPDDKIKQLHHEGMGAKAIATQLKTEQGIDVSYKTIQRVLSGQRN